MKDIIMKQIKNATIYHCDYCSKISLSKGGMIRHEISCKKNPNNLTPCASCRYCIRDTYYVKEDDDSIHYTEDEIAAKAEYYEDSYGDYFDRLEYHKETVFTCEVDGKKMYHNKVKRLSKEKREVILSRCDKQMPQECENYGGIFL